MNFGYLFSDLKVNIPANTFGGESISFNIPSSVQIKAGVRFPLN
jgi:hypothetical protein